MCGRPTMRSRFFGHPVIAWTARVARLYAVMGLDDELFEIL